MKRYYTRTFVGAGLLLAALSAAAVLANSVAAEAKRRYRALAVETSAGRAEEAARREKLQALQRSMVPVREFAAAWKNVARVSEHGAAEKIRSDIEAIAQRQLGLVTDSAITPQPERYLFQGAPMRVQRVSLRASGKDLAALLTWLGKVEEKYPVAIVEQCDFSSNVGGNTGLSLRLVQPLQETPARRSPLAATLADPTLLPEAIAAVPWTRYLPVLVKGPVAVGFQRNPLQPAVAADPRVIASGRDEADEITPRLEMALEGRVRSVIRGISPLIVVDGRVFRIGDEVMLGASRERPLTDAKTKLKAISDDHLLFQVAGGTAERPIQCEVTYLLPLFLKAR